MPHYTLYHNPRCTTSREVLKILQEAGIEPDIVLYLETPPNYEQLQELVIKTGKNARYLLREKEPTVKELGLDKPVSDDDILRAIAAHPILLNRPLVVKDDVAIVCRPAALVETLI